MHIERINVSELAGYLNSETYNAANRIPITRLRAHAQSINPRANPDDLALLVARDEGRQLLSYIGLMPDTIRIDNEPRKIWTISCWWGNPDVKENGSMNLFYLCCKITRNQILLPDLTPHLVSILSLIKGFTTLDVTTGVRGYLRLNLADLLPSKRKSLGRFRPLLRMFDASINLLHKPVLSFWSRQLERKNIQFNILKNIDDETDTFIRSISEHELFGRGKTELNWIIQNPWITTNADELGGKKYAFTCVVDSFEQLPIAVYKDGRMVAFAMLLLRSGIANLTYLYVGKEHFGDVLYVVYLQLLKRDVHTFTAFHEPLSRHMLSHRLPFIIVRKQQRGIAFSTEYAGKIKLNQLQYGDADCAFV